MKKSKHRLALGLLAVALLAVPSPGFARTDHPQYERFEGQILSVNRTAILVKGSGNYSVRSFSYTPQLSGHVARVLSKSRGKHGFHNGETVQIIYERGSDVAAQIKTKP